jgi:hypothetical protein
MIVPSYLLMSVAFTSYILHFSLALYAICEFLAFNSVNVIQKSSASSLVVPCLSTLVSNECQENEKGACMGVLRSLGALARAIGPLIGSARKSSSLNPL